MHPWCLEAGACAFVHIMDNLAQFVDTASECLVKCLP